jgi:Spy/CpxP family protein refolding chaperone
MKKLSIVIVAALAVGTAAALAQSSLTAGGAPRPDRQNSNPHEDGGGVAGVAVLRRQFRKRESPARKRDR